MKTTFALLFALLLVGAPALAQRETFGHTTYTPPKGWTKTPQSGWVGYHREDKAKKAFCQMRIYEGFAHTGEPKANFGHFWQQIVARPYELAAPAQTNTNTDDGWTVVTGTGQVTEKGIRYDCFLLVVTGYGVTVPYFFMFDNQMFLADIQKFTNDLDIKKLQTGGPATAGSQPKPPVANQNNPPTPSGSLNDGYKYTTTNFDDGWTSTIHPDWVLVTKGNAQVQVWYGMPYDHTKFAHSPTASLDHHWANFVGRHFTMRTKKFRVYNDGGSVLDYLEGEGVDKQTGQTRFVVMKLAYAPNTVLLRVASAPSEADFRRQFPGADRPGPDSDLLAMARYNRFAVDPADLIGKWNEVTDAGWHYAYINSSGAVLGGGVDFVSRSNTFEFMPGNQYVSRHQGARGYNGAVSTYAQEFRGKTTVTNWSVAATNRFEGQTDTFAAAFEVVRGGRILKLVNGGMRYQLVRAK
jgi:hypothetical protein